MLDIGVIIQAPMEDEEWLKKCALMGLITVAVMFIPIAGPVMSSLNALGWMRTYADARLRGEKQLPAPSLSYMGTGWKLFLMYLPVAGVLIAAYAVVGGTVAAGAALKIQALVAIGTIIGVVLLVPLILWLSVMSPGILFLNIVQNEPWASMQLKKQWRLMTATGTEYLLFWVAILVAGVIMEIGVVACGIGLIVSLPYGYAMYGAAIAEFAKAAKDRIPAPG